MPIRLKSKEEIERMRAAGRVVHRVLARCQEICRPGVTTRQIDQEALRVMTAAGAKGLFKDYPSHKPGVQPFPGNVCISINEQVVHGIGNDKVVVKDGDIVSVDCGVSVNGWCGDAAVTILVGNVRPPARRLCEVTRHCLEIAIQNVRPGRRWSQVARLMQQYAENQGMGVVKQYVGHGIGQQMHEEPQVPNYVDSSTRSRDIELKAGLVLAIEPMCNMGTGATRELADGWTVVTADLMPSAHYEHTVAITATGADVLTDGR